MIQHLIHPIKLLIVRDKKFYLLLREHLKITPGKLKLYEIAFLHRSASISFSDGTVVNNERLEYLGDAILDAVIADYLFKKFPRKKEGFLTQMRSKIVKRANLDQLARNLGVDYFIVSNTQRNSHKKHIYGDAFEALIGAIYLDKGYEKTRKYIINYVLKNFVDLEDLLSKETDYKSRIIEWGQKNKEMVTFETAEEYTEMEQAPSFVAHVKSSGLLIGEGMGRSKKEAEQNAAEQAYNNVTTSGVSRSESIEEQ
ncbi:MAG: ribonuclease III [Bacteroidota bacterium]|nr:ribonuclease III [Bacteroidota bacterium]